MLGLADIADKLEVDYTMSTEEVFKRAMITLLTHQQDLNPLSGCQWRGPKPGLPSWVIDLNEDFEAMPLRANEDGENLYHASGHEPACFSFSESGSLLKAQGFLFDTVKTIGPSFNKDVEAAGGEVGRCFESWLQLARQAACCRSRDIADEEVMSSFCRTLVADQDDRGERAAADFWKPYCSNETLQTLPSRLAQVYAEEASGFSPRVFRVCSGRAMLQTSKGHIGLAGEACRAGDVVSILFGAGVPFILRRAGQEFVLIGEAYVHGIMDGEAMEDFKQSQAFPIEIALC